MVVSQRGCGYLSSKVCESGRGHYALSRGKITTSLLKDKELEQIILHMLFKIRARGRGLASKFRSRGGVCRMERHGDESHGNAGCNNGKHLGIIYMYTLEFLHVHPVLPTCTSRYFYMYIQFFLHVHAVRPTCTFGFSHMYVPTPGYCARRWLRVYALIERVYLKGACWQ